MLVGLYFMVRERLVAVDDREQVRAVAEREDVKGQRKASQEGEYEFHVREENKLH